MEQFREQYLDRGRACLLHSSHAHIPPECSLDGAAFLGDAFLGAAPLAGVVDFVEPFLLPDADLEAVLALGGGAAVAVRSAAFRATIILGLAGRRALVFFVLT